MKKLLTLLLVLTLVVSAAFPAFAAKDEAPLFNTRVQRVANDPTVEYDEWDIPYNVWNPISDETVIHAGDTVTLMLSYTVPAEVEGYDPRLAASIEYITTVNGLDNITLVEAQGCPGRIECDYDIGICYPIPGEYANVELDGNELKVMAELGSDVKVIIRGNAISDTVDGSTAVTIGQYHFPAKFSLGTVDKGEANGLPSYNVHWSDFVLVQKRAVEFRAYETGDDYTAFVAMNNHYYRFIPSSSSIGDFIPVDENFEDIADLLDPDDPMYATLSDILTQVVEFFDLTYYQTSFTDSDFIGEGEHYTFNYPFEFGGDEEPGEPDPTPAPEDPVVPPTGTISFVALGIAAAAGAGIAVSRKKRS